MVMTMRVVGDREGKGNKAMATATRLAGMRTVTVMKLGMVARLD
jgi:hypothetical protein